MSHIEKINKDLTVTRVGGNIVISFRGTKLFAVRESDNQMLIQAGVYTDQTI